MPAQVVQVRCPGCKAVLRVPVDWLTRPMRCKQCGMAFQAKAKPKPPALPATAKDAAAITASTPPAARLGRKSQPKAAQAVGTNPSAATANEPEGVPGFTATLPKTEPDAFSDSLDFDPDEPVEQPRSRVRRAAGGRQKYIFVGIALLALIGMAAAAVVAVRLASSLGTPPTQVADTGDTRPESTSTSDDGKPPSSPPSVSGTRPKDTASRPGSRPSALPTISGPFPRRLLAISVNNYLYFNPVHYGSRGRSFADFVDGFQMAYSIPESQVVELSDGSPTEEANGPVVIAKPGAAKPKPKPKRETRPPFKQVIESTVTDFLDSCRAQDRIVLVFVGHAVEVEEQPFLVPLEGEPDNKDTFIPLGWLYQKLAACKARQKILIMDVCRNDPSRGLERPGSGPMGEKLDAMLKTPPAGIQVLATCVAGQYSYEFDNSLIMNGVFIDRFFDAKRQGVGIQRPEEPLPIANLAQKLGKLTQEMAKEIANAEQTPRLTGSEPESTLSYDPKEPLSPRLVVKPPIPPDGRPAGKAEVAAIINTLNKIPPVKSTSAGNLRVEALPPISLRALDDYKGDNPTSPMRVAIDKTLKVMQNHEALKSFPDQFAVPTGAENQFKEQILELQKGIVVNGKKVGPGIALAEMTEIMDEVEKAGEGREKEPSKRLQADYDLVLARLKARIAYLREYNYMLGQLRKELPPRDEKIHNGWKLASQEKLQSGGEAKRLAKEAKELLEKIGTDHKGTPWEILAKRERLTSLGLKWEPTSLNK